MGLPMSRLVETLTRPARSASHHLQLSQAPGDTHGKSALRFALSSLAVPAIWFALTPPLLSVSGCLSVSPCVCAC